MKNTLYVAEALLSTLPQVQQQQFTTPAGIHECDGCANRALIQRVTDQTKFCCECFAEFVC